MELKDQVCSLELAKKLKELGVKQESYFVWSDARLVNKYESAQEDLLMYDDKVSAFTVAELGEMLPSKIQNEWLRCIKATNNAGIDWKIRYAAVGFELDYSLQFNEKTEANARAKMLIYLIENNLITPTESNK